LVDSVLELIYLIVCTPSVKGAAQKIEIVESNSGVLVPAGKGNNVRDRGLAGCTMNTGGKNAA
jgi:hypothetical protein